jgi:hypothetical protein
MTDKSDTKPSGEWKHVTLRVRAGGRPRSCKCGDLATMVSGHIPTESEKFYYPSERIHWPKDLLIIGEDDLKNINYLCQDCYLKAQRLKGA